MNYDLYALALLLLILWYNRVKFIIWSPVLAALVYLICPNTLFIGIYLLINGVLLVEPVRTVLISKPLMGLIDRLKLMPSISQTEKIALRAGTVWMDGEIFSGKPDFTMILNDSYPSLTAEENTFLNKEVDEVCGMTNDYETSERRDLTPAVWQYLKDNRFFGMIIPKQYGGLGFSALGHSAVIQKLATHSQVLAITTMVPNSLGPAELLLHYGTQAQRDYYLPRLANGTDIPCFALTEPLAGSDATSIRAYGIVFKDNGETKIRLNFEKRYITLGAIASLIGLAFTLRDPDNILGIGTDLGITCALVKSSLEGVIQGRRHNPLGIPFVNSPLQGKDVVIGIDDVIGGMEGIGQGWMMLMESLAVGRGISLPSTCTGGIKLSAKVCGAYATVREQFGTSIGNFEGIESVLGHMAAMTYMMDAARIFTIGAIDEGKKPSVINAVMKYHSTELFRKTINDAMDIVGGAGISLGERNLIGHAYMGAPIAITV
ncbi:MAG TPA: acyl-CoA dehydrogenase, partial [Sulfuricurvum sp.]|nr:acyl-CoA dehydrogenase [Sulfuricurvum sp.]